MATGLMYNCEKKADFQLEGRIEARWKKEPAEFVHGVPTELLRCLHCHGKVRLHKQGVPHGPEDHVQHLSADDSANCQGGNYFKPGTTHRMSTDPNL